MKSGMHLGVCDFAVLNPYLSFPTILGDVRDQDLWVGSIKLSYVLEKTTTTGN